MQASVIFGRLSDLAISIFLVAATSRLLATPSVGSGGWNRTTDTAIMSRLLYL